MPDREWLNEDRLATALRYAVAVIASSRQDLREQGLLEKPPFNGRAYTRVWDDLLTILDGANPFMVKSTLAINVGEIDKQRRLEKLAKGEDV